MADSALKFSKKEISLAEALNKMQKFQDLIDKKQDFDQIRIQAKQLRRIADRNMEIVNKGDYKSFFFVD